MSLNLVLIGAGKLATQFSITAQKKGNSIVQVFSRTKKSAETLAKKLNTEYTTEAEQIVLGADLYFVAFSDSAFELVLPKIKFKNNFVVHCSGSMPLSALSSYSENIGVFYPLQTFSSESEVDFSELPIFIEANSRYNIKILNDFALQFSPNVVFLNSEKRKILHISAVFANNFVNHFYTVANELLKLIDLPFEVLKPLIKETAEKVKFLPPNFAQTGPAVRFDENIINSHLNELEGIKDFKELYETVSKSINQYYQENN